MSPQQSTGPLRPMNTVGRNVPRIDSYERVTGESHLYGRRSTSGDVVRPGLAEPASARAHP